MFGKARVWGPGEHILRQHLFKVKFKLKLDLRVSHVGSRPSCPKSARFGFATSEVIGRGSMSSKADY